MQAIQSPLKHGDQGEKVAALQAGLLLLNERSLIKVNELAIPPTAEDLRRWAENIQIEVAQQFFGDATLSVVSAFQMLNGLWLSSQGVVDSNTAALINKMLKELGALDDDAYRVFGSVIDSNGQRQAGVIVKAWDRDLRKRQLLGQTKTSVGGDYAITYEPSYFAQGDMPKRTVPWLIVEVLRAEDGEVAASVEIKPDAMVPSKQVDMTIPALPVLQAPEWQRINEEVKPLLDGQDVQAFELTMSDVDFIQEDTKFDRAQVMAWAEASRMLRDAIADLGEGNAEKKKILTANGWQYFYALVRQGLANNLNEALRKTPDDWKRTYEAAGAARQVAPLAAEVQDELSDCLQFIGKLHQMDAAKRPDSPLATVLKIKKIKLPQEIALKTLNVISEHGIGQLEPLLKLRDEHPADAPAINATVRGLRLHELTGGNERLMASLSKKLDNEDDTIAPLARMALADWAEAAKRDNLSTNAVLPMLTKVELQHPVAAFQARVANKQLPLEDDLLKNIAKLAKDDSTKFENLYQGKTPILTKDVLPAEEHTIKNLGVFSRLGLSMELSSTLMKAGIVTPAEIMFYDWQHLRDLLRKQHSEIDVNSLLDNARDVIDDYLAGGRELVITAGNTAYLPPGLYEIPKKVKPEDREMLPNISSLFGELNECECRHCDSMLGQSAYLVDLLQLLRHKPEDGSRSPLDALRTRRADIFRLPLNCNNAESVVQHIDLVLELLQREVANAASNSTESEIIESAYNKTARSVFPWQLPFGFTLLRYLAYLNRLGLKREEVFRLIKAKVSQSQLAAETLSIPYALDDEENVVGFEWSLLTLDQTGDALWELYGFEPNGDSLQVFIDPASGEKLVEQPVRDVAQRVSVLMDRTGLDLNSFKRLIATTYVGKWNILNEQQCKTSLMKLGTSANGVSLETCLNRIHRLVRLQRKWPNWSFGQMDAVISAGAGNDVQLIERLARLRRISEKYHLPIDVLSNLQTSQARITKLLGVRASDYDLLVRLAGFSHESTPIDWDAFEKMLSLHEQVEECGLSIQDVALAFLPRETIESLFQPLPSGFKSQEQIATFLKTIQARLRATKEPLDDVSLETQANHLLTAAFGNDDATYVMQVIKDVAKEHPTVAPARAHELLTSVRGPANDTNKLPALLWTSDAQALLRIDATNNASADTRFEFLLNLVSKRQALIQAISELAATTESDAIAFLSERLMIGTTQAHELFLVSTFWAENATIDHRLSEWADRLHRLAALQAKSDQVLFELISPRLNWYQILANLSATGINEDQQALLDWMWLGSADRVSVPTLFSIFSILDNDAGVALDVASVPLAHRLGVPEEEGQKIARFVLVEPTRIVATPANLKRVYGLLRIAKAIGANSDEIEKLLPLPIGSIDIAIALLQRKLNLDMEGWGEAVSQLENPLRQLRRDALVAYLVQKKPEWRNENDLYEHYLIDPQVEPCMKTTRILEAITATQLFAQRVLFGLEEGVRASAAMQEQMPLMRNYRVNEANKKVFLFPENWMYPELRDDKSSSFKVLEAALGQGELTADLADEAFGKFLDDVTLIGQLQVLGLYEEKARNNQDSQRNSTVYVVGRTPNPPYAYFWRKCTEFGGPYMEWSPWQKIELDIQGEHVLPFVMGDQLHVAWPVFNRKGERDPFELKFQWSRFDGKTWGRVDSSAEPFTMPDIAFARQESSFTFRCTVTQKRVNLICFAIGSPDHAKSNAPEQLATQSVPEDLPDGKLGEHGSLFSYAHKIYLNENDGPVITGEPPARLLEDYDRKVADMVGAINVVTWDVWIPAIKGNGDSGFVKLDHPVGDAKVQTRVGRTSSDVFQVDKGLCAWLSYYNDIPNHPEENKLPAITCQASMTVRGKPFISATVLIPEVARGKMVSSKVVLVMLPTDQTAQLPTITELGITDPATLKPAAEFSLMANGVGRWGQPGTLIPRIFPGSINWMNGYRGGAAGSWPLSLPLAGGIEHAVPFNSTDTTVTSHKYWLLPPSDLASSVYGCTTWFYQEEHGACFIDVEAGTRPKVVRAYPATFTEAADIRYNWWSDRDLASNQRLPIDFDAISLSRPSENNELNRWQEIVKGKYAFDRTMPYACYSWEIFYHAPLYIADQLSKQHRFEEAEHWLRYVFDPTAGKSRDGDTPFIKVIPLKKAGARKQVIENLNALAQVAGGYYSDEDIETIQNLIDRWRALPFRPFVIARERHAAFLWRAVFSYLDNLIAWADSLYRRDTRESNNEAMMLYVLAIKILGVRPKRVAGTSRHIDKTYDDIAQGVDAFGNFWLDVASRTDDRKSRGGRRTFKRIPSSSGMLYFCMPFNDKLNAYWETLEDRLFNLRNCRNIEGVERDLAFVDPPIDPELLVRATAAGLDLTSVINDLYAPPSHYRYSILSARASELASEAKALGSAMLSAMEKRDGEQLAQLRSSNEIALLSLVSEVKKLQIQEAEKNIDSMRANRKSVSARYEQFQRLLGLNNVAPEEGKVAGGVSMLGHVSSGGSGSGGSLGLIESETQQIESSKIASQWSDADAISRLVSSLSHLGASVAHSNVATSGVGDTLVDIANVSTTVGESFRALSQINQNRSASYAQQASNIRRRDEWAFQNNQVLKELEQIDKQILANQIRIDLTKKELSNHLTQIEQNKAMDEVLRSKFTNVQLYEWMSKELYSLYDKVYRMALDMARSAQRAAVRELGQGELNIIGNGYWDSLRSGLLAGEKLHQDIKRLDVEYLNRNKRELEITKHVSLRQLDPEQLLKLRATGACTIDIPEWLFDLDFPSHYYRRIKSVSVSIPCVVGPYSSISGTLTLQSHKVRDKKVRSDDDDGENLTVSHSATQSIATSTAQNDSGMFELNFRDERYLPFEFAGAISSWKFELADKDYAAFDYDTISDLVLHIRYTAREGGAGLSNAAKKALNKHLNSEEEGVVHLYSLKHDFATELAAHESGSDLELTISDDLRPYICRSNYVLVDPVELYVLKKTTDASGKERLEYLSEDVPVNDAQQSITLTSSRIDIKKSPHLLVRFKKKELTP